MATGKPLPAAPVLTTGYGVELQCRNSSHVCFCTVKGRDYEEDSDGAAPDPFYKWRMLVSYDGTKYAGWQVQEKPATVQLMLQEALVKATKLSRESLVLVGASRTDTGVHAVGQVAQFHTPFELTRLQSFHASLNGLLPSDIRVKEIAPVQRQFHARYSAKRKIYHYKVYCEPIMDPFNLRYALHVRQSLNVPAMQEAARSLIGEHDFTAFANVSKQIVKGGFVREIYKFDIVEKESFLLFIIEGNGFLYRQVRNMVGLLLQIGKELLPASAAKTILASGSRKLLAHHAPTAPPRGLYLMSVVYDEGDLELPEGSLPGSCGIFQTHSKCKLLIPKRASILGHQSIE